MPAERMSEPVRMTGDEIYNLIDSNLARGLMTLDEAEEWCAWHGNGGVWRSEVRDDERGWVTTRYWFGTQPAR